MTPALWNAQNGLAAAGKRFGAASTAVVAASAAGSAQVVATDTARAVRQPQGGQAGGFERGGAGDGRLPLPEGLLALLQEAGVPQARGRWGTAPSLEQASAQSLLAQRAFEANLRSLEAAGQQLGDTLNLLA